MFLVGADGKVVDRFEGTVSVGELDAAVRQGPEAKRGWLSDLAARADALDHDLRDAARGLRRRHIRTTSAQSSGLIISSPGIPEKSAIGVSTKPGQSAIARTPSSSRSALSEWVRDHGRLRSA